MRVCEGLGRHFAEKLKLLRPPDPVQLFEAPGLDRVGGIGRGFRTPAARPRIAEVPSLGLRTVNLPLERHPRLDCPQCTGEPHSVVQSRGWYALQWEACASSTRRSP